MRNKNVINLFKITFVKNWIKNITILVFFIILTKNYEEKYHIFLNKKTCFFIFYFLLEEKWFLYIFFKVCDREEYMYIYIYIYDKESYIHFPHSFFPWEIVAYKWYEALANVFIRMYVHVYVSVSY